MLMPPKLPGRLNPGILHVWSVVVPASEADLTEHLGLLSPDEQARANRYIRPSVRHQFITVRALLRFLVGHYLQYDPHRLCFQYSASGKPSLCSPEVSLRFNLSHSKDRVLYAISQDLDIGIDVEWCNPQLQHRDIARRICTPSEWLYFSALSAAQQQANFFRIWTRKEALIKLFGDRLFDELQSYEVATPTIFRGWVNAQNQRVWLQDLELFDDFAAAIAVLQPPHHIFTNHWEWQA